MREKGSKKGEREYRWRIKAQIKKERRDKRGKKVQRKEKKGREEN